MSFKLITPDDLKDLTKGKFGEDFDPLLDNTLIPAVGELFSRYCNRPDWDRISRAEYFSPLPNRRRLFLSSPPVVATLTSIRTAAFRWTLSAAGAGIYYIELVAGGNPALADPSGVLQNGGDMLRSATGPNLQPGYFFYGNIDALAFNTLYVRLTDSADPDTKPLGYLQHVVGGVEVYQDTGTPRSYGSSTRLQNGDDFFYDDREGIVERSTPWPRGFKTVKVVYTGGYLTADAVGLPDDVRLAAIIQAKILFDRREEMALANKSLEGSSIGLLTPLSLPRSVTILLDPYRIYGEL